MTGPENCTPLRFVPNTQTPEDVLKALTVDLGEFEKRRVELEKQRDREGSNQYNRFTTAGARVRDLVTRLGNLVRHSSAAVVREQRSARALSMGNYHPCRRVIVVIAWMMGLTFIC